MKANPCALDDLLAIPLLAVPESFAQEVMLAIEPLPSPIKRLSIYLQWLALLTAVLVGIEQVLGLIVGVWLVQSLG